MQRLFITAFASLISVSVVGQELSPEIGDYYGGGIVFWINPEDPWQGLVCDLYDHKRRFRDVTLKFDDGIISKDTYNAKSELYWTENEWPAFSVAISESRRRKGAQVLGTSLAKD